MLWIVRQRIVIFQRSITRFAHDVCLVLEQENNERRLVEDAGKMERLVATVGFRLQLRMERQQCLRNFPETVANGGVQRRQPPLVRDLGGRARLKLNDQGRIN